MKIALLISGYLRTFKYNLPNLREKILQKFPYVDVYVHFTLDEKEEDSYLNLNDTMQDFNFIIDELKPKSFLCEKNFNFTGPKRLYNTFNHWFKFYKLNKLKKIHEETENFEYDLVIKYRPDLVLESENIFSQKLKGDIIYIPKESVIDKTKLTNYGDEYICDILAYGNSKSMDQYFEIFKNLENLSSSYGSVSETLLFHYLKENSIKYELKEIDYKVLLSSCNIFAICGDSGSGKSTLGNILKKLFQNSFMLECDRYHKWERNDNNWNSFTHLNPESNFLSKMNQDIFDLKVGKTIYQVDYDHKSGKFTEKMPIDSSDNLIVCGLHSLYTENTNLYNLKIFMDTEDELKKNWKIQRDTKERGYDVERILKQIEKRSEDYEKYILPQKNISDLIVKFYERNNKICLKISINKKKSKYQDIITEFKRQNIFFESTEEENFINIDFGFYKNSMNLDSFKIPKYNNFYDYLIYVIINLGIE